MSHPFSVNSTYANNLGEYTVLEIKPPNMRIRYADGREQTVSIALQTRIWRRLQAPPPPPPTKRGRSRAASDRRGASFLGLLDSDFKDNVTGTHWRSREGLGGLVTKRLCSLTGKEYTSWAIYRRPECFIYAPHLPMRNRAEGVKLPKLLVELSPRDVRYGLYIEKSDEAMDDTWYWPCFLELLAEERWQQSLERVMDQHQLHWRVDVEQQDADGTYAPAGELTASAFTPEAPFPTFAAFVDYLRTLPADQWCNLFLIATLSKQQALIQGIAVAETIAETLAALSPMYLELVRRR
jgi:hypothetical protein